MPHSIQPSLSALRLAVIATLATGVAAAQTHIVKKPETVVRAIAVYEYTGEPGKITASRLVPVSIFINAQLDDAGVYKAAPVPFALGTGTVFELDSAGAPQGTLEVSYQRHLQSTGQLVYEDGWLGYGAFKPIPQPGKTAAVASGPLSPILVNGKPAEGTAVNSGSAAARKPVDRSSAAAGRVSTTGAGGVDDSGKVDASVDPDDKSDRPTLKRREPDSTKDSPQQKKQKRQGDVASVRSAGSLNDDPDRPVIHRGAPAGRLDEDSLPPLVGLPADMKQLVAVSDAKDRPEHVFTRSWDSDSERIEVLSAVENAARARLAHYDSLTGLSTNNPAPAKPAIAPKTATSAHKKSAAPVKTAATQTAFTDEQLRGYTLSYGGSPTFVYTASAVGAKGVKQYVTVVAQREGSDSLKLALTSVTDEAHLDRTPWMRFVDAVDAEASNRASLLFELRAQQTRQFALYRVIGGAAEQTLSTGTNP